MKITLSLSQEDVRAAVKAFCNSQGFDAKLIEFSVLSEGEVEVTALVDAVPMDVPGSIVKYESGQGQAVRRERD